MGVAVLSIPRPRMRNRLIAVALLAMALGALFTLAGPAGPARAQDAEACSGTMTGPGDPCGDATGSSADVLEETEMTEENFETVANQVGKNKIAINVMWTLVAGFLVMFMQAGFALVE